jgi:hypothetical protein
LQFLDSLSRDFFGTRESIIPANHIFQPSLEDPFLQKDLALAFEAFNADAGADSHHFPFVAAAGVRFAQPDYVTELHFCNR